MEAVEDLEGKKIATSYPRLVRAHLARARVRAEIIKLDGAVEISVQLGLADAIADVVSLRPHPAPARPRRGRRADRRVARPR